MSKYRNRVSYYKGMKFASQRELKRYKELELYERAGIISKLQFQVPFVLIKKSEFGRTIKYIADFTYYNDDGRYVVEDAKGFRTDTYKIKKRLMAEIYKIEIKEV